VGQACCFQVLVISHASTDAGSLVGWKEVPHRPRVGGLWIVNQIWSYPTSSPPPTLCRWSEGLITRLSFISLSSTLYLPRLIQTRVWVTTRSLRYHTLRMFRHNIPPGRSPSSPRHRPDYLDTRGQRPRLQNPRQKDNRFTESLQLNNSGLKILAQNANII